MVNINEEILSSIDNIDDCVMEAELAVINSMYDYCQKAIVFYENYEGNDTECFDVFMEATTDGTKKSFGSKAKAVFAKIWNAIKAFFRFIIKQLTKIVNFIKKLFKGKKKTVDQIITDCGVKPNKEVHTGEKENIKVVFEVDKSVDEPKTSNNNTLVDNSSSSYNTSNTSTDNSNNSGNKTQEVNIDTTVTKQNTEPKNVEKVSVDIAVEAKETLIKMMENGKMDVMVFNQAFKDNPNTPIPGQDMTSNNWYALMGYAILTNKGLIEQFASIIDEMMTLLQSKNSDSSTVNSMITKYKNFISYHDNILSTIGQRRNDGVMVYADNHWNSSIELEQFIRVQQILNDMMMKMDRFAIPQDDDTTIDHDFIKTCQSCLNVVKNMQTGVNNISRSLSGVYKIDKRFVQTINDPETLDKFVFGMIKYGVPSKYVAYNAWLACTKDIVDVEKYSPIWGQSRIIFFPNNKPDSVYKVALSSMGLSANKSELFIYNKMPDDIKQVFAKPNNVYKNGAVQDMVKCDTSEKVNSATAGDFSNQISEMCMNSNMPFRIGDLHSGNFGKFDNKWVCFDYGSIIRVS